jgi:hypothetical protein
MMKSFAISFFLVLIAVIGLAQQPLNKRDQIRKAEFEAQIAAEKKYDALMKNADDAFKKKEYASARMTYYEAIQYNPANEQWLISKVNDLDILMAKIIMREVDSVMVLKTDPIPSLPKTESKDTDIAPRAEKMGFVATIPEPEPTEVVPPPAPEPKPEPEIVVDYAKPEPQKTIPIKPAPTPKKEEVKVKDDYSRYPQGLTDEIFEFPDHTVRRIIVKDGIDTIVYKYVTHRWGGKFYFKDDISIVERIWKEEVENFQRKYPSESPAE